MHNTKYTYIKAQPHEFIIMHTDRFCTDDDHDEIGFSCCFPDSLIYKDILINETSSSVTCPTELLKIVPEDNHVVYACYLSKFQAENSNFQCNFAGQLIPGSPISEYYVHHCGAGMGLGWRGRESYRILYV